jgi:hypothetical protein
MVQNAAVGASCLVRPNGGIAPRRRAMTRALRHMFAPPERRRNATAMARALQSRSDVQPSEKQALHSPPASPFDALGRVVEASYDLVVDRIEFARTSLERKITTGLAAIVLGVAAAPLLLASWGLLLAAMVVWLEPVVGLGGALACASGTNLLLVVIAAMTATLLTRRRDHAARRATALNVPIPSEYKGVDMTLAEAGADIRRNTGIA